jgi:hypothetical protein
VNSLIELQISKEEQCQGYRLFGKPSKNLGAWIT